MKIAFSLLHYNNIDVTREAVSYLLKLKNIDAAEIVIVDNCSPNQTGIELQSEYERQCNIHVLLNKENGGFAKGNNVGYLYAVEKLNADCIIVMNNDVFIKDTDFINKLGISISKTNKVHIIAPGIIGRNGNQNPFRTELISSEKLKKLYQYNTLVSWLYSVPVISSVLAAYLDSRNKHKHPQQDHSEIIHCVPHGACIIYTPQWVQSEKFAFLPATFMYFEEDILAEYVYSNDYCVAYDPNLTVYHVEDATVDSTQKTSVKKRKFIAQNMRNSIKVLINIRKGDERA